MKKCNDINCVWKIRYEELHKRLDISEQHRKSLTHDLEADLKLLTSLSNHTQSQAKKIEELQNQVLKLKRSYDNSNDNDNNNNNNNNSGNNNQKTNNNKQMNTSMYNNNHDSLGQIRPKKIIDIFGKLKFSQLLQKMTQAEKWESDGSNAYREWSTFDSMDDLTIGRTQSDDTQPYMRHSRSVSTTYTTTSSGVTMSRQKTLKALLFLSGAHELGSDIIELLQSSNVEMYDIIVDKLDVCRSNLCATDAKLRRSFRSMMENMELIANGELKHCISDIGQLLIDSHGYLSNDSIKILEERLNWFKNICEIAKEYSNPLEPTKSSIWDTLLRPLNTKSKFNGSENWPTIQRMLFIQGSTLLISALQECKQPDELFQTWNEWTVRHRKAASNYMKCTSNENLSLYSSPSLPNIPNSISNSSEYVVIKRRNSLIPNNKTNSPSSQTSLTNSVPPMLRVPTVTELPAQHQRHLSSDSQIRVLPFKPEKSEGLVTVGHSRDISATFVSPFQKGTLPPVSPANSSQQKSPRILKNPMMHSQQSMSVSIQHSPVPSPNNSSQKNNSNVLSPVSSNHLSIGSDSDETSYTESEISDASAFRSTMGNTQHLNKNGIMHTRSHSDVVVEYANVSILQQPDNNNDNNSRKSNSLESKQNSHHERSKSDVSNNRAFKRRRSSIKPIAFSISNIDHSHHEVEMLEVPPSPSSSGYDALEHDVLISPRRVEVVSSAESDIDEVDTEFDDDDDNVIYEDNNYNNFNNNGNNNNNNNGNNNNTNNNTTTNNNNNGNNNNNNDGNNKLSKKTSKHFRFRRKSTNKNKQNILLQVEPPSQEKLAFLDEQVVDSP